MSHEHNQRQPIQDAFFPDLADIHIEDIRNAIQTRNVEEALEIFDVAVGHFGIETIRGNWVDNTIKKYSYCTRIAEMIASRHCSSTRSKEHFTCAP